MRTTNYIISILALAVLTLMGCKDEIDGLQPCSPSNVVMFSTSFENAGNAPMTRSVGDSILMEVNDWVDEASLSLSGDSTIETAVTRSAPVTALSGSAGIYGYVYDDNVSASSRVFTNEKFNFDGDDLVPETPYAWKRLENLNKAKAWFCSYAPYEAGSQITPTMYNSNPGVTYTVPATPAEQIDFLYASSSEIGMANPDHKQKIPFEYHHALTAIQFRMGFACKVKSVSIKNVKNSGTFTFANGWEEATLTGDAIYTIDYGDGQDFAENDFVVNGDNTLMLMPQSFGAAGDYTDETMPKVVLVYEDGEGNEQTISASLANSSWVKGKKIVYTIFNEAVTPEYVYFDIAAGSISIAANSYSGYVYVGGTATNISKSGISAVEMAKTKFYVYQSSTTTGANDKKNTGYVNADAMNDPANCRIPNYANVTTSDGKAWGDFITNNTSLQNVSTTWLDRAASFGRTETTNKIAISGASINCDITLDNVWIDINNHGTNGALSFWCSATNTNSSTTIRLKGDNRLSQLAYCSQGNSSIRTVAQTDKTDKLTITSSKGNGNPEGTLTVGLYSTSQTYNHYNSVIGGTDNDQDSYGIHLDGGTIYAASTQTDICTAIGGGGNGVGGVFITGGRVTAVVQSTSAAIGGGIGYSSNGGNCLVEISGGEVYAYNLRHTWNTPAAAIGGGSSNGAPGNSDTTIRISGGTIYAESASGVAIGGGGSTTKDGGPADIYISGGNITATSVQGNKFPAGVAIGGGPGGTDAGKNGGTAKVYISGNPVINTGSIGGGKTNNDTGKVGSAQIEISGSPIITGQFIMAAGAASSPSFTMSGGTIINSDVNNSQFTYIEKNGAVVNIQDGTFTMTGGTISGAKATATGQVGGAVYITGNGSTCNISGGTIKNCSATRGGAIYMNGGTFNMSGGTISSNKSDADGGAVYISGGNATVTGGTISNNYAKHGNGGGVYLTGGNFSMPSGNGTITQNTANSEGATNAGSGGGIYIASTTNDVTAEIISGTITNNTADHDGGGMCVDMGGSAKATITIGAEGGTPTSPVIDHNSAALSGGGMCVLGTNSDITIYSGTIKGNVSAFVQNEDVRNDGGTVTLVGTSANCDVKYNTVIFHTNYDDADAAQNKTAEQRIVTHTNSKLAPPADPNTGNAAWTYEWHNFVRWNTQRDGTGTDYAPGTTMNISADVHLYAIWESTN